MFNRFIVIIWVGLLSSCAGLETRISDVNRPLSIIQSAIYNGMPVKEPSYDSSKRKFKSVPFLVKGVQFVPASNSRIRYEARAEILGTRRPYSIYLEVARMQSYEGVFRKTGQDREIAKMVRKKIEFQLSKSGKESNVIDDFRVF